VVDIVDSGLSLNITESITLLSIVDDGANISIQEQDSVINIQETEFFVQVVENYNKPTSEVPVGSDFNYNIDGTLSSIEKDSGVTTTFTYSGGELTQVFDGVYTKVLTYTNDELTRIDVT
tara:strand:- start:4461 stop:4820 length:360 start_codon:yes stop_codon:yes gene_type:complete